MMKVFVFVLLATVQLASARIGFGETPEQCIMSHCSSQAAACLSDTQCSAFADCGRACGSDTSCATRCLPASPNKATAKLVSCAKKNGCGGSMLEELVFGASPSGTYSGSKSVAGQHVQATVTLVDGTHMNLEVEGPIALKCNNEEYRYDGDKTVTLPNAGTSGNCIHDALAAHQGKINSVTYDSGADSIGIHIQILGFVKVDMTLTHGGDVACAIMAALGDSPAQCILKHCETEATSCLSDHECKQFVGCAKSCGSDTSCAKKCLPASPDKATSTIVSCAKKNGCVPKNVMEELFPVIPTLPGASPEQCLMSHCPKQAAACLADSGCSKAATCARSCSRGDDSCYGKCQGSNPSAATKAVAACGKKNHCNE